MVRACCGGGGGGSRARTHTYRARTAHSALALTASSARTARARVSMLLCAPCRDSARRSPAPRALIRILAGKKAHAAKERDNDYLVQQAKIRDMAAKKRQHQAVFEKKYAPAEMAQSWTGASTLRRGRKVTSPLT